MPNGFNFDHWRERLHACEDFADESKSDEFLDLLTESEKNMVYEVAVELLRTFSDADDFGIQERTRNILEAADRHVFYPALVQELEGVIERSPEKQWAVTLLGIEVDYGDFRLLLSYVNKAPESVRRAFISFIKSEEFLSEYPGVSKYLAGM
ncbi:hypothetical protein [Burkholderia cenocepacia]|uniref:Immunity protein 30 domain-containing protein n=2 Tax=Burkholderia cenocepacia TaxID=95486 RepID=A0AAD0J2U0_9BURK|nr:hypothetical protein [Burkholderia cenocepacia]AWG28850.1 hypothetical protein B9Z07_08280 [Burkholderia cenocepacia]MBR8310334.1 hypothetical protein [Burkholderia cenocepacia]MCA7967826.1 hypothetical protein [Burkholderia cenocepacia]MCF1370535.1 hypothetical protein [Burkholderia cenocepacia]MCF1388032.1 hypothetical protein [Burkholderia cenocepacia]